MLNLLYKELRLAIHPTCVIFIGLTAMLLIPNYPYSLTFFYTCLGIFYLCMSGRENHDIFYSLTLPVKKKDIVSTRILLTVILQMIQIVVSIPFALLRNSFTELPPNQAGMDANLAMYGFSLIEMGIFNIVFFTKYYKNTYKVGISFVAASISMFLALGVFEASAFAVPFVKDYLDNTNAEFIPYRAAVLVFGVVVYVLLTLIAHSKSVKTFCESDF